MGFRLRWRCALERSASGNLVHKNPGAFQPGDTGQWRFTARIYFRTVWYRKKFDSPSLQPDQRLLLHFGGRGLQGDSFGLMA